MSLWLLPIRSIPSAKYPAPVDASQILWVDRMSSRSIRRDLSVSRACGHLRHASLYELPHVLNIRWYSQVSYFMCWDRLARLIEMETSVPALATQNNTSQLVHSPYEGGGGRSQQGTSPTLFKQSLTRWSHSRSRCIGKGGFPSLSPLVSQSHLSHSPSDEA
jgi:hypothetical protein